MENSYIKIRGARQHNLKNVDLDIPKNKLVVLTGVSGSGKSSMAFDTIYAEGQRRYVESLSTYARQFLGIMEKPDVDSIEGLSPAISIDQKTTSKNPRSTVGTQTEIYDYLRLLFARIGHPHCPICHREIASQSVDQITKSAMSLITNELKSSQLARFLILAPLIKDRKGEFADLFSNLRTKGITQVRLDNLIKDLDEDFVLLKTNKHTIDAVIDKISLSAKNIKDPVFAKNLESRLTQSFETALKLSDGLTILAQVTDNSFDFPVKPKNLVDHLFSEKFSCPFDNISLPEIEPRSFSFNSPHGACEKCLGVGKILVVDPEKVFAVELSISEGGILPFTSQFENDTWFAKIVKTACKEADIDITKPIKQLTEKEITFLLAGSGEKQYKVAGNNRFGQKTFIYESFPGIVEELTRKYTASESDWLKGNIERFMINQICPKCAGTRLKPEAKSVTIDQKSIADISTLPITKLKNWVTDLQQNKKISDKEHEIGRLILQEIYARLAFLESVGLEYLNLSRTSSTLSGGEAQRIRLASQIGSGLSGVLYVLDEPTIGLHAKDNQKLIDTLQKLKNLGNTVIVVEHDLEMMRQSDWIVDFGPSAGKHGGEVVAQGPLDQIVKTDKSVTGKFLSGKRKIESAKSPNTTNKGVLSIKGVNTFNLKDISVDFPLGKMVVITGVSGSGKSSLLVETLYPALVKKLNDQSYVDQGQYKALDGVENVNKVVLIDQSPIGRTPRSNPATYTKLFDQIRDIFERTRESRALGFKKGRFSFNVKGGRCEECEGQGQIKIEMQFMSDIWVTCEVCQGKRYNSQTLDVVYRGKNIAEVLGLTVTEAKEFFHTHGKIGKILETLEQVGLGYMELGQSATTLSGGEAQRIKLATELAKRDTGNTVYVLDEPTTGLHMADLEKLLKVLKVLVTRGNSVFLIEHNLDVIKNADWIIDMGPDGGEAGGEIVAVGTIENIRKNKASHTAKFLA